MVEVSKWILLGGIIGFVVQWVLDTRTLTRLKNTQHGPIPAERAETPLMPVATLIAHQPDPSNTQAKETTAKPLTEHSTVNVKGDLSQPAPKVKESATPERASKNQKMPWDMDNNDLSQPDPKVKESATPGTASKNQKMPWDV